MKQPDMAFTGSEMDPSVQDAPERAEWPDTVQQVHPSMQALHESGFGPVYELGDVPMKSEWRLWVIISLLCVPWAWFLVWALT